MSPALENRPHYDKAIVNPANPNHWMVVHPIAGRLRFLRGETLVAETRKASFVVEMGRGAYAPRVYFPLDDLVVAVDPMEKSTHCPLKGDASYFALQGEELGWRYQALEFAKVMQDQVSLWDKGLTIEMMLD